MCDCSRVEAIQSRCVAFNDFGLVSLSGPNFARKQQHEDTERRQLRRQLHHSDCGCRRRMKRHRADGEVAEKEAEVNEEHELEALTMHILKLICDITIALKVKEKE